MDYYCDKSRIKNLSIDYCNEHLMLKFSEEREIVSTAILNGGVTESKVILNRFITKAIEHHPHFHLPPEEMLKLYAIEFSGIKNSVGMLTAAPFKTYKFSGIEKDGVNIEAYITSGISNARRAGDRADVNSFEDTDYRAGTINIIVGTNALLEKNTLLEAIMIITEAKVSVMEEMKVISPISGKMATGTGTDAIAVYNGNGRNLKYCGKHVLFGEMLGSVVKDALKKSLTEYLKKSFKYV